MGGTASQQNQVPKEQEQPQQILSKEDQELKQKYKYSSMSCKFITPQLTKRLLKSAVVSWLREIDLSESNLGSRGCYFISKASLKTIQRLNLQQCKINDAGMIHLSKTTWKKLKYLNLMKNVIRENGAKALIRANWKSIEGIALKDNQIPLEFAKKLLLISFKGQRKIQIILYNKVKQYHHCVDASTILWQEYFYRHKCNNFQFPYWRIP